MIVSQNDGLVQQNPQGLQPAFNEAQKRIQELESKTHRLEQERNQLCSKAAWLTQLLAVPSSVLSGNQKICLIAAVNAYEQGTPDPKELVHITIKNECKRYGLSAGTMGAALTYCAEKIGALARQTIHVRHPTSGKIVASETYIGLTSLTSQPNLYAVAKERNNGGTRKKGKGKKACTAPLISCKGCNSANIERRTSFYCIDCGQYLSEQADEESPLHRQVNLTTLITKKPITPPLPLFAPAGQFAPVAQPIPPPVVFSSEPLEQTVLLPQNQDAPREQQAEATSPTSSHVALWQEEAEEEEEEDLLRMAAELWATLVLPAEPGKKVYATMSVNGPKKYYDESGALTPALASRHLLGEKTLAARIGRDDGRTRLALWDADTDADWNKLQDAARLLAAAGYAMLLEPSPAARGGHLGTIFDEWVQARAAYQEMCRIAPVLAEIKEYWLAPGVGCNNKVRLFAGLYRYQGINQWCTLQNENGTLYAHNGKESALVLLAYQTPAELIPPSQEPEPAPTIVNATATPQASAEPAPTIVNATATPQASAEPAPMLVNATAMPQVSAEPEMDAYWQKKYGHKRQLWFHFHSRTLITAYNERTPIGALMELERNGMMLSPSRSERTASVAQIPNANAFIDFGASAQRSNGKQDGGDAFELSARLEARNSGTSVEQAKRSLLAAEAKALILGARTEMERAARAGQLPPQWLSALMSEAGWRQYWQLRRAAER